MILQKETTEVEATTPEDEVRRELLGCLVYDPLGERRVLKQGLSRLDVLAYEKLAREGGDPFDNRGELPARDLETLRAQVLGELKAEAKALREAKFPALADEAIGVEELGAAFLAARRTARRLVEDDKLAPDHPHVREAELAANVAWGRHHRASRALSQLEALLLVPHVQRQQELRARRKKAIRTREELQTRLNMLNMVGPESGFAARASAAGERAIVSLEVAAADRAAKKAEAELAKIEAGVKAELARLRKAAAKRHPNRLAEVRQAMREKVAAKLEHAVSADEVRL